MEYFFAFTAGILSFTSACILPLIPSYLAVITGLSVTELRNEQLQRSKLLIRICIFIVGLIIPLILLGMTASSIGSTLTSYSENFSRLFGFIVILFGLHLLGLLKVQLLNKEIKLDFLFKNNSSLWSVALMGLAFGFGWTPCIGPMLSSILLIAADAETMWLGGSLLFVYGLGLGLPFLIIGLLSTLGFQFLHFLRKQSKLLSIISGLLLLIVGLLLISGNMAYITPAL